MGLVLVHVFVLQAAWHGVFWKFVRGRHVCSLDTLTLTNKQVLKKQARRHKRRRGRKTKVLSPTLGLKLIT
jgi:D-alanyl-lipoteichoic acid acyltransferase DltB (MBOAT superfamily)